MDRHVVDPLLGLMLDHVQEMLRSHVLDVAAELLEHLIDRHRSNRYGRSRNDLLADVVDVLTRRQIHHRVGTVMDRHVQLLKLLLHIARDGRIANVRVDLALGRNPDGHRLQGSSQVNSVRRNHHPTGCHLVANQLRSEPFPLGDKLHLRGDLTRLSR